MVRSWAAVIGELQGRGPSVEEAAVGRRWQRRRGREKEGVGLADRVEGWVGLREGPWEDGRRDLEVRVEDCAAERVVVLVVVVHLEEQLLLVVVVIL